MEKVFVVQMPLPKTCMAWQPWLGGYYGTWGTGSASVWGIFGSMCPYIWIDQDVKYSITGKR